MEIVRFGRVRSSNSCSEDFQSISEGDFAVFKAGIDVVVGQEVNEEDNEIARLPAGLPRVFGEANWVDLRRVVPMMRWRKLKVIFTAW